MGNSQIGHGARSMGARSSSRIRRALFCTSALITACGEGAADVPSYEGILTVDPWVIAPDASRSPPDAAPEAPDAAVGDADAAGLPDAQADAGSPDSATPPALPSNTPWAEHVYAGDGSNFGLVLRASNLQQSPSGDEIYARWLITVENQGARPICSVVVYGSFRDADDDEVLAFSATTDGVEHTAGGSDVECIPAGGTAPGWSNTFIPAALDLDTIERIEYRFGGAVNDRAVPITGPRISALTIDPAFGRRIAAGVVTNGPDRIQFPSVIIYPIDETGMPLDRVLAIDSIYVAPFATWAFETLQSDVPIIASLQVLSFLRP